MISMNKWLRWSNGRGGLSVFEMLMLATSICILIALTRGATAAHTQESKQKNAASSELPEERSGYLKFVDEYKTPGLETELSGIYPHLTDDNLYYVVTNGRPTYKPTMKPMLPVGLRNKLLTVNRDGQVVKVVDLPDSGGLFGDLAFGDGHLWLGPLDPPALWKLDLATGKVVARFSLPGPAGGMEFDRDRGLIIVQSYIGHPHLAIVNPKTGMVVKSLWSDENCQGVAKVDGDLLTVYASGWDADAFTELWSLDQETGRPKSRLRLTGVHAAMAPLDKKVSGFDGFMTLVHVGSSVTGETVIRRYRYVGEKNRSSHSTTTANRVDNFAAIQFSPSATDGENLEHLAKVIADAAARGAKYVVLPELSLLPKLPPPSDSGYGFAQTTNGSAVQFFARLAERLHLWLAFSIPEKTEDEKGYYVTALLLNPDGQVVTKHRKRVLRYDGQDGPATVGFARQLMDTIDDQGRRIGILSGDDLQSGVPRLAQRGADAILVCANWRTEDNLPWTKIATALATEFNVHLVIANRQRGLGGIFSPGATPLTARHEELLVTPLEMQTQPLKVLSSLGLPSVPIPSNEPLTPGLVELGRQLFFDSKLSSTGTVSCSSCHVPEKFFSNGKAHGDGVYQRQTSRNVPSLLNAAFKTTLHWDGNPTTLEQQVKYPLAGYAEMNFTSYDGLKALVRSRPEYVAAFRSEMSVEPEEISREHIARALAGFQRTLISGGSAFDLYFYGKEPKALTESAQRGLRLFTGKAGCVSCHTIGRDYALFMDGKFHTLGIGYVSEKDAYVDPGVGTVSNNDYAGMFFTPSLRNVAETAPYMHDGSIPTLEEAIRVHFRQVSLRIKVDSTLRSDAPSDSELSDLVDFLRSLTGQERYNSRAERIEHTLRHARSVSGKCLSNECDSATAQRKRTWGIQR